MKEASVTTRQSRYPSPSTRSLASSTLAGAGAGTLGFSTPAFKISFEKGIPPLNPQVQLARNRECVEGLMSRKNAASVKTKFDGDPKKRTLVPLNLNDIGNWDNMELMGSLRSIKDEPVVGNDEVRSLAQSMNLQPPSFYEADLTRWKNKFTKAIADRAVVKKRYLSTDKKTTSILATNDNFVGKDADAILNEEQRYVGGGI